MAHDITKDVIGCREFEGQKVNQSGQPMKFYGDVSIDGLTTGSVLFSDNNKIAQDNSNLFWDNVNKRLGIGTVSPVSLLNIKGDSADFFITQRDDKYSVGVQSNAAGVGILNLWDNNPDSDSADAKIHFTSEGSGATNNWINNGGNVGINTTSPDKPLTIQQPDDNDAIKIYGFDDKSASFSSIYLDAGGDLNIDVSGGESIEFDIGAAGKMRINSDGNVGINDSTPASKLSVDGTMNQSEITQTFSGTKVLTDNSATGFVEIAVATGDLVGGEILYTMYVDDGTDLQAHTGGAGFVAVNKAGTVTSDCQETYLNPSSIKIVTAGTLTDTLSCTDGAGKITINFNANTSLDVNITLHYTIRMHSMNTIVAL